MTVCPSKLLLALGLCALAGAVPSYGQDAAGEDPAAALAAISVPETWSAGIHIMMHLGTFTIDMTGDVTTHGSLVRSRMVSGVGGQMLYVKVYTGADRVQWTELSMPPKRKQVVKLDLVQVEAVEDGTFDLSLIQGMDGSSRLGVNMGDWWKEVLAQFGEDATVSRVSIDGADYFAIDVAMTERTRAIVDPQNDLAKDDIFPTELTFRIGAEDGLLRHMALAAPDDGFKYEILLKDVVVNPDVDPASFEYTPPEGITPEDVTKQVIAEITGVPVEEEPDPRLVY